MRTRQYIFLITSLFYTLYIIFPLFGDVIQFPVWFPSVVTTAILIILYPLAFKNKITLWFLIYAAVLLSFVLIGKPLTIGIGSVVDKKKILIEFAYIIPSISVFSVFYYLRDYKLTKTYVTWSTIILYASFIVAIPLMIKYSSLRVALSEEAETLVIPGLPSYSLMHAYTLFLPQMCYAIKYSNGIKRWWNIVALLALCVVIYSTYVTTSLIVLLCVLFLTFIYSKKHSYLYFFTLFFLLIVFFFLYELGVFVSIIDAIQPMFEGTSVEPKLNDLRASMVGGELQGESIMVRQRLHAISWNSFLENPLWGNGIAGDHSAILDRFGGMGILGGFPFLMIFISLYRTARRMYQSKSAKSFFLIGFLIGVVYLYEKGNWGAESWFVLSTMMPMALWVLGDYQEADIHSKKNE